MTNSLRGDILGSTQNGYETFLKTDLMDFGAGDRGFIWEADPVKRKEVAKRLLPAFAPKATKAKEPTVHYYIDLFIERMKEIGSKGDGIEITKVSTPTLAPPHLRVDQGRNLTALSRKVDNVVCCRPFCRPSVQP